MAATAALLLSLVCSCESAYERNLRLRSECYASVMAELMPLKMSFEEFQAWYWFKNNDCLVTKGLPRDP
jgi:hypothetical protein